MINIQSFAKAKNTGSSGSSSKSSTSQSSINNTSTSITEDTINIFATSDQDMTEVIQSALDAAYTSGKKIVFGSGEFLVTRAVYIHDGTVIEGQGIYNTIIRTPFMKKPSYFEKDTLAYQKATVALGYVTRDKKKYNTATDAKNCPTLDLKNGHNRFYLGDGAVGYYDGDRDKNKNHPLYYPNDNSEEWKQWDKERTKIQSQGRWVGLTGRENYSRGLIKSSQQPNLTYPETYKVNPNGTAFTGVRDISISNICITTNSSDRGKDDAINFNYSPSSLTGSLSSYDSSVLNVSLSDVWLRDIGGNAYEAYRAVQNSFKNVGAWRVAESGFKILGVTSVNFTSCYCNSCLNAGYNLKGTSYSSLQACAADGCGVGYKLDNCNSVTLQGCGAEASRYTNTLSLDEEDGEIDIDILYRGNSYFVTDSNSIGLYNCYAFAFRGTILTSDDSELDIPDYSNTSRHIHIVRSKGVIAENCYLKSMQRIRTTPFRNSAGKCSITQGKYDETDSNCRTWLVQTYLVGKQYEIVESDVSLVSNQSLEDLKATNSIRCSNLDFLDPGTVANPNGYDTAGKTLSDRDGNGGWTRVVDGQTIPITMEDFEALFPLNATKKTGERTTYWEWRHSLILLRVYTETVGQQNFVGYRDKQPSGAIDWSTFNYSPYRLDVIKDRTNTDRLDGNPDNWGCGDFIESTSNIPIVNYIPATVNNYSFGSRVAINNQYKGSEKIQSDASVVTIMGNQTKETLDQSGSVISSSDDDLLTMRFLKTKSRLIAGTMGLAVKDSDNYLLGGINAYNTKDSSGSVASDFILSFGQKNSLRNIISRRTSDYESIAHFSNTKATDILSLQKAVNEIITRLENHGLVNTYVAPPIQPTSFSITTSNYDATAKTIDVTYSYTAGYDVYGSGIAYSSTNTTPTYSQNHIESTLDSPVTVTLKLGNGLKRYVRIYLNKAEKTTSDSDREYSQTFTITNNGVS